MTLTACSNITAPSPPFKGNDRSTAWPLEHDVPAAGIIDYGSNHWYKFTAESDKTYRVEWENSRYRLQGVFFREDGSRISMMANLPDGLPDISSILGYGIVSGYSGTVYLWLGLDGVPLNDPSAAVNYSVNYYDVVAFPPRMNTFVNTPIIPAPGPALVLSLSSYEGTEGFRIYRAPSESGPYEHIAKIAAHPRTHDFYRDTDVSPGSTYWYKAVSYNAAGEGLPSKVVFGEALDISAVPLNPGEWVNGSFVEGHEPDWYQYLDWYSFSADAGTSYALQWNDGMNGDSTASLTEYAEIHAYREDGSALVAPGGSAYYLDHYTNPPVISGYTGTVYVQAQARYRGTYALRYYPR